jgi:anti-anti-sigma factor
MQIQQTEHTLHIRGLCELNAVNAHAVRDALCAAIVPGLHAIEIDLSQLHFVDGCGLGALAALYRTATEADAADAPVIRLINPQPAVQQVIELTRLHHLFEITSRPEELVNLVSSCSPNQYVPVAGLNALDAPAARSTS